jgi:HAD superfamily hydrolase (TIGR01549 family)
MKELKAIGFDLFNTLITIEPPALKEALGRLLHSLKRSGFTLEEERFRQSHREAAVRHLEECKQDGRETHNRFWISLALESHGYEVMPEDSRIADAVEAYFTAFYDYCNLIPGTKEMLRKVRPTYRLGMLTNFTHGPAARKIIDQLGLAPLFDVILISGELGFRKPNPLVFQKLCGHLDVLETQIMYVGDDAEPDILGALNAGIQPVWVMHNHEASFKSPSPQEPALPAGLVPMISSWQEFLAILETS